MTLFAMDAASTLAPRTALATSPYFTFSDPLNASAVTRNVPDARNAWGWHNSLVGNGQTEVIVDANENGVMDTSSTAWRVYVTDGQIAFPVGTWAPQTFRSS